nr:MAG TPA: hypothetical protein [Caudoviricetes sp.]
MIFLFSLALAFLPQHWLYPAPFFVFFKPQQVL